MKYNVLNRKIHYWATTVIAVPIFVIIGSGESTMARSSVGT